MTPLTEIFISITGIESFPIRCAIPKSVTSRTYFMIRLGNIDDFAVQHVTLRQHCHQRERIFIFIHVRRRSDKVALRQVSVRPSRTVSTHADRIRQSPDLLTPRSPTRQKGRRIATTVRRPLPQHRASTIPVTVSGTAPWRTSPALYRCRQDRSGIRHTANPARW